MTGFTGDLSKRDRCGMVAGQSSSLWIDFTGKMLQIWRSEIPSLFMVHQTRHHSQANCSPFVAYISSDIDITLVSSVGCLRHMC